MFYHGHPMSTPRAEVDAAVADLRARWGAAAPRVMGSLALAPQPVLAPQPALAFNLLVHILRSDLAVLAVDVDREWSGDPQ